MLLLDRNGGVDSAGIDLEIVKLFFWDGGYGAVCSGAKLKIALNAIVLNKRRPQNFGKLAGGMASKKVHLEESILRGDEALGEDEIIEGCCPDMGHTVHIPLNGDRGGESLHGESTIDLWKRCLENVLHVAAGGEKGGQTEDEQDRDSDGEVSGQCPLPTGLRSHRTLDQLRLIVLFRKAHLYAKSKCRTRVEDAWESHAFRTRAT